MEDDLGSGYTNVMEAPSELASKTRRLLVMWPARAGEKANGNKPKRNEISKAQGAGGEKTKPGKANHATRGPVSPRLCLV